MDYILLKNMGFFAYHGTTKEERAIGQRFYIDIKMTMDLSIPGKSDNVADTVDYQQVFNCVGEIVQQKKYRLIEALAEDVADNILVKFPLLKSIQVWVRKPQVPLNGILDHVEVCLTRENIRS